MLGFIDTHFHIEKEDNIDELITKSKENNVNGLVASFCDINSIKYAESLSKKYHNLYYSYGFHPYEADSISEKDINWLEELIRNNTDVVAIGEIGLDYHYDTSNKEKQIALFKKQLELAEKLHLPVVIHSRDATLDTINILKGYDLKGVIHCFSGSLETAKEYIRLGYYIGIGGVITFKNSKLCDVVRNISINSIVLETDSPYLSPEPFRGAVNSPRNIPIIAEAISQIQTCDIKQVEENTTLNAITIFDLKK